MKRAKMNRRTVALGASIVVAAACGCASAPTAEIDGTGYETGPQTQTVQCGTGATLDRNLMGGVGKLTVQVIDGANATIYLNSGTTAGESDATQELTGASGTWTLLVDPYKFIGEYQVTLKCQ
jgi:spore coat protein U-like protein